MDDKARRQTIASSDLCIAGFASIQAAAFLQQFRPGGTMNGAIHSPTAQQGGIRRIHDGIDIERGDVGANGLQGGHAS
jgi:hypothetical protein